MFLTKYFRLGRRTTLHEQVDAYLAWKSEIAQTSALRERPPLHRFVKFVQVGEISEIEIHHLQAFRAHLRQNLTTQYAEELALRSVRGLLRYYHARGHICPSAKAMGSIQGLEYKQQIMAGT